MRSGDGCKVCFDAVQLSNELIAAKTKKEQEYLICIRPI
jgi:hypothetical protein